MAVVAIFGALGFQYADAFTQQRHLVSQRALLLSELVQFFVFGHACTLLACSLLCKPLVLLVSYERTFISGYSIYDNLRVKKVHDRLIPETKTC